MHELCLLPPQGGVFFEDSHHRYFYRRRELGFEAPSSSQIIELAGGKDFDKTRWRLSLMRKGLDQPHATYFMEAVRGIRAAIGTEVHAHIERYLLRGIAPAESGEPTESERIFRQWLACVYPRIGKVYVVEQPMVHPGGLYGMTPDLLAEVDGILSLSDWKSAQARDSFTRYKNLIDYRPDDLTMKRICAYLAGVDAESGSANDKPARVRPGWQMQQGAYAFGIHAVHGLQPARGLNFMLSDDGAKDHLWNSADLSQGWMQFAGGLLLHHQRSVRSGGHEIFRHGLNALAPLFRPC